MSKHYTIDQIDCFVHGSMEIFEKIKCSIHLKSCSECKELLSQVENDKVFLGKLKEALQQFEQTADSPAEDTYNKIEDAIKGQ